MWVRAERQLGGRGRQGREWSSLAGNLHASTLVRIGPGDPPAATLALVAGLALHEIADLYAGPVEVRIKWPNDLIADGAKLAGILLERIGDAIIIGFGVNLVEHPDSLERPATSIRALSGSTPEPGLFLEDLSIAFARWLSRWRTEGLAAIRAYWLSAAHPPGTALSTHGADTGRIEGLFDGLDDSGALRLRLGDGTIHIVHAGDVFLI